MFPVKPSAGEKEYKNDIMIWDPFFDNEITEAERELVRLSGIARGHVWMSFDPAETMIGFRQERRFKGIVKGERSQRFSIYTDIYEYYKKLPDYGFLDEVLCCKCKCKAKWLIESQEEKKYYCGMHSKEKNHPTRKEILYGRNNIPDEKARFRDMFEYKNIYKFLESLDFSEVRFIIIERQMAINYHSMRVSQAIISFLFSLLRERKSKFFPIIYEINPKIKSRVYGVTLPKPELKKWTLRKAIYHAIIRYEIAFLALVVKDDWPEKLIELYNKGELTEGILWDLVEPERNYVVKKEKDKVKKEQCILAKANHDLFDICDVKEQIESLIIELGFNKIYSENEGEENGERKGIKAKTNNLPMIE